LRFPTPQSKAADPAAFFLPTPQPIALRNAEPEPHVVAVVAPDLKLFCLLAHGWVHFVAIELI
jgi:hypothetical protein